MSAWMKRDKQKIKKTEMIFLNYITKILKQTSKKCFDE